MAIAITSIAVIGIQAAQAATTKDISAFFGTYEGKSSSVTGEKVSDRDLRVSIRQHEKKGFTVEWSTTIRKKNGKLRTKELSINFYPVNRPGMYESAMRRDVFGHLVPFNPIAGDPYVWAGLDGDTLTVSALYLIDGGGYEIQVYKRTLTEAGMSLDFERVRDGKQVTRVLAELERVKE